MVSNKGLFIDRPIQLALTQNLFGFFLLRNMSVKNAYNQSFTWATIHVIKDFKKMVIEQMKGGRFNHEPQT